MILLAKRTKSLKLGILALLHVSFSENSTLLTDI